MERITRSSSAPFFRYWWRMGMRYDHGMWTLTLGLVRETRSQQHREEWYGHVEVWRNPSFPSVKCQLALAWERMIGTLSEYHHPPIWPELDDDTASQMAYAFEQEEKKRKTMNPCPDVYAPYLGEGRVCNLPTRWACWYPDRHHDGTGNPIYDSAKRSQW